MQIILLQQLRNLLVLLVSFSHALRGKHFFLLILTFTVLDRTYICLDIKLWHSEPLLIVHFSGEDFLKGSLISTSSNTRFRIWISQALVQILLKTASSVRLPVWKFLHVFPTTLKQSPVSTKSSVSCFHRNCTSTGTSSSHTRSFITSVLR